MNAYDDADDLVLESPLSPDDFRDDDFWTSNAHKFIAFAERRIRRYPWRGTFDGRPPGGKEASDYIADAASLLISGQWRTHTSERTRAVYYAIASLVWHDFRKLENRTRHRYLTIKTAPDGDEDETIVESVVDNRVASIDEVIAACQYLEQYKANFSDNLVRRYLDLMADGYVSAVDSALELGVVEDDIWRVRKIVRRARRKWPGQPPRD